MLEHRVLKHFIRTLTGNDVPFFLFAGYGMQIDGLNYLAAVDTDAESEVGSKHSSLPLNRVIKVMEKTAAATIPSSGAWTRLSASRGLAPAHASKGILIAWVTLSQEFTDCALPPTQLAHRRSKLRNVGRDVGRKQKRGARPRVCFCVGGVDGTRTRDPRRDRPVF